MPESLRLRLVAPENHTADPRFSMKENWRFLRDPRNPRSRPLLAAKAAEYEDQFSQCIEALESELVP